MNLFIRVRSTPPAARKRRFSLANPQRFAAGRFISRLPSLPGLMPAALLLFMIFTVLTAGMAWGLSENEIEQKALLIAGELRCPTCQGVSVKDSTAPLARQIHDKVRRMVAEGQSGEAIKAFFVSRYGEWILRAPKKEGLGLVLWLLPGVALLVSAGLIGYRLLANQRKRAAASPEPTPTLTPAQRARIASDIKTFEEQE